MNQLEVKLQRTIDRINRDFKRRAAERVVENVCEDKGCCEMVKCGELCDVARHDADLLTHAFWWEFCRWN
jgi:hypothetical protein